MNQTQDTIGSKTFRFALAASLALAVAPLAGLISAAPVLAASSMTNPPAAVSIAAPAAGSDMLVALGFTGPLPAPFRPGHFVAAVGNGAKLILVLPTDANRAITGSDPVELEFMLPGSEVQAGAIPAGFMYNELTKGYGKHFTAQPEAMATGAAAVPASAMAVPSAPATAMDGMTAPVVQTPAVVPAIAPLVTRYGFSGPLPAPFKPGHFVFSMPSGAKLILVYGTDASRNIATSDPVEFELMLPKAAWARLDPAVRARFMFNELTGGYGRHFVLTPATM